jgi:hypothetical protein
MVRGVEQYWLQRPCMATRTLACPSHRLVFHGDAQEPHGYSMKDEQTQEVQAGAAFWEREHPVSSTSKCAHERPQGASS